MSKFKKGDKVQAVGLACSHGARTFEVVSDTTDESTLVELMTLVPQNGTMVWVRTRAPLDAVIKIK